MELTDVIDAQAVRLGLKPNSKRQLLQELSALAAQHCDISERTIFETLLQRERLGSTGVGNGIAIPHGKFAGLKGIFGVFVRLDKPVDYDSLDDQPIDLACLLLAPEGAGADHLKALSRVARALRDPERLTQLRACDDTESLHSILTAPQTADAA